MIHATLIPVAIVLENVPISIICSLAAIADKDN